jgi:branched-chain amino acid transport system substrate-binding protein
MYQKAISATLVLGIACAPFQAAFSAEPIKLGVLEDQSGDFAVATVGKVHAIQLAAEEINEAGGIAGRPLELVIYDTQSDNTRYQEFMRRVLQRDKVDAVFAGFSSASREAYRPIVRQFDGFAFYNNQYEGGVCDANMIVTGAVPEQQFSTLLPWMMEQYGKRVYTIAADYNFGQISAEWVRRIVEENGGEMAGEEFIPLGVSQFSQTIQNIQRAKPDFVVTLLVGTAQSSYYEQAMSANLSLPMASSVNVGQ